MCATPLWIFEDISSIDKTISFYLLAFLSVLFLLLYLILRLKNEVTKKRFSCMFFACIFFYGLDVKLNFWHFFEKILITGALKYFASATFLVFLIYLFFKFLSKNVLEGKKLFLLISSALFMVNLFFDYSFNLKHQSIENINIIQDHQVKKKNNNKTIILFLDEMIGYNGINNDIKYGELAKKSYLEIAKKFNFELYASAYSIYPDTKEAIPYLLNFDFQIDNYLPNKYSHESLFDNKTKWKIKTNKFFEQNRNKKIVSNKNQALNYCEKTVLLCISSNAINNKKKYINDFNFSSTDFFIKKMYEQKSIISQYIWKILNILNPINDYNYLMFNKVKFENDLENISKIISYKDYDIYFFHLLFPHRPFSFEIDIKKKECKFNDKYIDLSNSKNKKKVLEQHYKEIICTNYYLNNFLEKLKQNASLNNMEILLIADTGLRIKEKDFDKDDLKNLHSTFFAIKNNKNQFKINNDFLSTQELFSLFFKKNYNGNKRKNTSKVYSVEKEKFIQIDQFSDY